MQRRGLDTSCCVWGAAVNAAVTLSVSWLADQLSSPHLNFALCGLFVCLLTSGHVLSRVLVVTKSGPRTCGGSALLISVGREVNIRAPRLHAFRMQRLFSDVVVTSQIQLCVCVQYKYN